MQVVIDESVYKRRDKRKKVEEVQVISRKSYDPNLFNLLKLSPEVLAKQITLCDVKRFRTISADELRTRGWEKKEAEKLKLIPNIFKFTTNFNQISYWVAGEILKECSVKLRAEKMSYFIKMTKCLDELNNYHSLLAVTMGMNLNAIFRLHNTWEVVSKKDKALLKSYVDLSDNNWQLLKDKIAENQLPFIPHFGAFLQELSGINSHPKMAKSSKELEIQNIINTIKYYQQSSYDIQYIDHVQDFLASEKYILELQRFVEDDILKLSFEREPINKRTPCNKNYKLSSRSLEDITLVNPLHDNFARSPSRPARAFKPGHRKANSLSVLEGFNNDQEKAGTALLLQQSPVQEKTFQLPDTQNLIDDSWHSSELQRNRSVSEPPPANCVRPRDVPRDMSRVRRDVTYCNLGKISEIAVEGVLLKKTCQKFGKQPKLRRWKAFYCIVSDGRLSLYMVKGHKSASGIGQSSVLKKTIPLSACAVTITHDLKHQNVFTVADVVGNIYKFKDAQTEDADGWVTKIQNEKRQYPQRSDLIDWD